MKRMLIIGAGRFGQRAVAAVRQQHSDLEITVIDKNECRLEHLKVNTVCQDGIDYLSKNLCASEPEVWIIPAIPAHVAYEWLRSNFNTARSLISIQQIRVPDSVFRILPNPINGRNGAIYISNADFICPEDCPEPCGSCMWTGTPRSRILHEHLQSIQYLNFRSIVVISRQVAQGVGGYTSEDLFSALSSVKSDDTPVLFSTACKCHGVMHAFRLLAKPGK
jgi:hypothetical protein